MMENTSSSKKNAASFEEERKKYTVQSALEIGHILQGMRSAGQQIQLRFAGSRHETVTSILNVDVANRMFLFDAPADPELTNLAGRSRLFFEGKLDRIAISFTTGPASVSYFENAPAFQTAFPERLIRLQRREFFRVSVLGSTMRVSLPAEEQVVTPLFSVRDISQTGCCLVDPEMHLEQFIGKILPDCTLSLSGTQPLGCTIEVCNAYTVTLPDGKKRQRRVGCRFVDLDAAKAALIQRYIMQVERKNRALLG